MYTPKRAKFSLRLLDNTLSAFDISMIRQTCLPIPSPHECRSGHQSHSASGKAATTQKSIASKFNHALIGVGDLVDLETTSNSDGPIMKWHWSTTNSIDAEP
ncbi:unnamed protein product [Phytophthora lilii]|uniref:Unnamed protein product n=1 Tax=Phytophthora lilii TaxID=2077276 RepID=A0A9W6TCD7_9STRA|nr:unnamed protein product [Phytophthora lilii]